MIMLEILNMEMNVNVSTVPASKAAPNKTKWNPPNFRPKTRSLFLYLKGRKGNLHLHGSVKAPMKKAVDINQEGCGRQTFKEIDNHETGCNYHPGPTVFHDRMIFPVQGTQGSCDGQLQGAGDHFWIHDFLNDTVGGRWVVFTIMIDDYNLPPQYSRRFTVVKYHSNIKITDIDADTEPSVTNNTIVTPNISNVSVVNNEQQSLETVCDYGSQVSIISETGPTINLISSSPSTSMVAPDNNTQLSDVLVDAVNGVLVDAANTGKVNEDGCVNMEVIPYESSMVDVNHCLENEVSNEMYSTDCLCSPIF